jgi:N-methylhydantoinase B
MHTAMQTLLAATEQRMRRAIGELPDGSYGAADSVEGVAGEGMIPIAVQLGVVGDRLSMDFARSGAPSRGAINVPLNALLATVYYALKACLDPGLPSNAGLHRSVAVSVPEVSILNAHAPSAVGARTDTCQCVAGCIIAAFSQARPGCLPAPSNDASTAVVFSGVDPRSGADYVYVEAVAGGAGAGPDRDGMDAVQVHITNTSNLPVEALEHAFPLLVERYELAPDSGGPGVFRGGLGAVRAVRVLEGEAMFSAHGDRHERPARGAAGGGAGGLGAYVIKDSSGRHRKLASKVSGVKLLPGDRVEIRTPGGGGYGRPAEREPGLVRDDIRSGVVSPEQAAQVYEFDPESEGQP